MNKAMMLAAALLAAAVMAGCTRRDESLVASQKASANVGDSVAKDIHDKLDKAKAAGKAVEDAGKAQGDKLREATEAAERAAEEGTQPR